MAARGCGHLRLDTAAIKSLPSAMAARGCGRRGRWRRYAWRPSPSSSTSPLRAHHPANGQALVLVVNVAMPDLLLSLSTTASSHFRASAGTSSPTSSPTLRRSPSASSPSTPWASTRLRASVVPVTSCSFPISSSTPVTSSPATKPRSSPSHGSGGARQRHPGRRRRRDAVRDQDREGGNVALPAPPCVGHSTQALPSAVPPAPPCIATSPRRRPVGHGNGAARHAEEEGRQTTAALLPTRRQPLAAPPVASALLSAALLPRQPPATRALLPAASKTLPTSTRRGKRREEGREEVKKRGGGDVVSLTCGAHMGPTLTQPPRQIKPGSKSLRDLK
ncbi:uncharacterized protein [Oryza sativa Japonica Group]|uniref:uncharacterized protein n=1 Tax=Oryza sativa subsp. japonica TaxID=39947 RepID=UPI00339D21FC